MKVASSRSAAAVSVCRWLVLSLDLEAAEDAERAVREEGKIKEDGTIRCRFLKLSLSAHWLAGPRTAPWFWTPRAVIFCKALASLGFVRHYRPNSASFGRFQSRMRA
ncbi:hypothetical protein D2T29_18660 [Sinirhodobacter populi]|uniref:Uncharacterized protein n=1 Tax=Paenirhodobacter populi TaxID=2306993 RepID=A0A443K3R5_9RHOB|nr:hypothetical protein [Sinirhodobacter populi]RWR27408.1 hypothetical protein D2T29_18660 [Sinirhodobacter populi]